MEILHDPPADIYSMSWTLQQVPWEPIQLLSQEERGNPYSQMRNLTKEQQQAHTSLHDWDRRNDSTWLEAKWMYSMPCQGEGLEMQNHHQNH